MSTKALDGAKRKGRIGREQGYGRLQYPYTDDRNLDGGITWSRSFINAWVYGWDERDKEIRDAE